MRITELVRKTNRKMNNYNLDYEEFKDVFDEAIRKINQQWHLQLPKISLIPEMVGNVPGEYTNLPDAIIEDFVIPFAAGSKFMQYEQDGSSEISEAANNLDVLSFNWGHVARTKGPTPFKDIVENLDMITESTDDLEFGLNVIAPSSNDWF